MSKEPLPGRFALVVGHPGHELRVLGWMRACKPIVLALTDGAGHGKESRVPLSRQLLGQADIPCGSIFGQVPDRQVYKAVLDRDFGFFLDLSDAIARSLETNRIDWVAGDSIEGYNPTHDLCRLMIDRAVRIAARRTGGPIANFQFPLMENPAARAGIPGAYCHRLEPSELQTKLAVCRWYVKTAGGTLAENVEEFLCAHGEEPLADEWFSPASTPADLAECREKAPFYERHGEKRVAEGHYKTVIRYEEHIAPIAQALQG